MDTVNTVGAVTGWIDSVRRWTEECGSSEQLQSEQRRSPFLGKGDARVTAWTNGVDVKKFS